MDLISTNQLAFNWSGLDHHLRDQAVWTREICVYRGEAEWKLRNVYGNEELSTTLHLALALMWQLCGHCAKKILVGGIMERRKKNGRQMLDSCYS